MDDDSHSAILSRLSCFRRGSTAAFKLTLPTFPFHLICGLRRDRHVALVPTTDMPTSYRLDFFFFFFLPKMAFQLSV